MDLITMILLLIFYIFGIMLVVTFIWGGLLAAPWVGTRRKDVKRMLELAKLKPGEVLYDLGSGDGRLIIGAAKNYGAKAVGFEVSLLPFLLAWVKILGRGLSSKVKLKYKNFYGADLSGADVITTFLMPKAMEKLKPKFERELKPGSRIVSYTFSISGWQPAVVDKPRENDLAIYVYRV